MFAITQMWQTGMVKHIYIYLLKNKSRAMKERERRERGGERGERGGERERERERERRKTVTTHSSYIRLTSKNLCN